MNHAFSINQLRFSFDENQEQFFFNNVTAAFQQNTMNFVRGKNGAGKSTFFRILMGKIERSEFIQGTINIKDRSFNMTIAEERNKLSHYIRLAPQKFDEMLADQFTFTQNLALASLPKYPGLEIFVEEINIPPLVDRFGINYHVPVSMLSGGQRQILAILMALQKPTSILLLDEPTAALDDKNASMVISFLNALLQANKELTVLIICHDKELVEEYAHDHYHQIEVHEDKTRTIELIPFIQGSKL